MNPAVGHGARRRLIPLAALDAAGVAIAWAAPGLAFEGGEDPVNSTVEDFFQRGTQPETDPEIFHPLVSSTNCTFCHSDYDPPVEPYAPWTASMMGQSARDPMFYACLDIANQDAEEAGQFCIRCHSPIAFLADRADPADATGFAPVDYDGINCNFCHRVVNPAYPVPGDGPATDEAILDDLAALDLIPPNGSNARYVVDPTDSRRGPFDDIPANLHAGVEILVSPFHQRSEFCWTCHDVSNPLLERQPDDTYVLEPKTLGAPHSSGEQSQMFPLHRTYSEWKNSYYFTLGGIQHNGRFGGNHINNPEFIADGTAGIMRTCQDCHMPDQFGQGCAFGDPFFPREDAPQHSFSGSNTWVLEAIRVVDYDGDGQPDFPDEETGLTDQRVADAIARTTGMLQSASDLELSQVDESLRVRIINFTGHKLPTGFPDGRRMWINVKFLDAGGELVAEHGAYDEDTGQLAAEDTKVYEVILGVSTDQAAVTGLPEGDTFHFVLANQILKDNRIPPAGFSNTIAQIQQTESVGATFIDGQNWDDTDFVVPTCAVEAQVTIYYQVVSLEYATFLRDTNLNPPPNRGTVLFDLWDTYGRPARVVMDMAAVPVSAAVEPSADLDGDGAVSTSDLLHLLSSWGTCQAAPCPGDFDCDGTIGTSDLLFMLKHWG